MNATCFSLRLVRLAEPTRIPFCRGFTLEFVLTAKRKSSSYYATLTTTGVCVQELRHLSISTLSLDLSRSKSESAGDTDTVS